MEASMKVELSRQLQFERTLSDICAELSRIDFTLEIWFPADTDDSRVVFVADRRGDNYVFTDWDDLIHLSEMMSDPQFFPEVDHGL